MERSTGLTIICRIGRTLCSLPVESVVETFRPLAVERVSGAPAFVLGLAIVRGMPMPVVDLAQLITGRAGAPTRFVVVKAGERRVALAVDAVVAIRPLAAERLAALPPLLSDAEGAVISAVGALDAELFLVLQTSRLVPEGLIGGEGGERLAS